MNMKYELIPLDFDHIRNIWTDVVCETTSEEREIRSHGAWNRIHH